MSEDNKSSSFEKETVKNKTELKRNVKQGAKAKSRIHRPSKKASSSAQKTQNQSKHPIIRNNGAWAGLSAGVRFFSTEVLDDNCNAKENTSHYFDFSVDAPGTGRQNKDNAAINFKVRS